MPAGALPEAQISAAYHVFYNPAVYVDSFVFVAD